LYHIVSEATFAAAQTQDEADRLNQLVLSRQTQNKEAKQITDSTVSLKLKQQNLLNQLSDFQKLQVQRSYMYGILYFSIVTILPYDVSLNSITEEEGKLKLACQASNYEAALGYAYVLKQTGRFSDVQVHSLKRLSLDEETVSFTISLKWE